MSSDKDSEHTRLQEKRRIKVGRVCERGLESAAENQGLTLLGFSARMDDYEVLITLRFSENGNRTVGFVGGETLAGCLIKAWTELNRGTLKRKEDQWGPKGG